jgi:hypothetical protein
MWLAMSCPSIRDGGDWLDPVPAALLQGKSHMVPLDRALGGPWSQCGPFGKKGKYFALVRNETVIPRLSSLWPGHYRSRIHIIFLESGLL